MEQITKNTPKEKILEMAPPCGCEECRHGCRMGSGLLAEGDAKRLAQFLGTSVEDLKKTSLEEVEHFNKKMLRPRLKKLPYGKCTFFDEQKGCTIHEAKPLQCKVAMGCKPYGEELMIWFMLNEVIDATDPESVRQYASYHKAGGKIIPGGNIEELIPDKEALAKMLDYRLMK